MRVVEVNSIDQLPGLRLAWKALLHETPNAGFHQSCQWLEAVCCRAAAPPQLRILLVSGPDELVGILPLVQTARTTAGRTVRVLGYLVDPCSPWQGPIGPQPTATLMAALRYLADRADQWDVLELGDVCRASGDYQRTRTALEIAGMHFREIEGAPAAVVDVSDHPGELSKVHKPDDRLSREFRVHRFRPRGVMYNDAKPHEELFERCLNALVPHLPRATPPTLLRDLHAAACRAGAADLNLLRQGRRIIACCYNVHFDGTLLTLFAGEFDAECDPGQTAHPQRVGLPWLVDWMRADSQARQDRRWFPGPLGLASGLPALLHVQPLERVRFYHTARRGTGWQPTAWLGRESLGREIWGRLADWLPGVGRVTAD